MTTHTRAEQNTLLLRFLTIATIIFLCVAAVLYWQQTKTEPEPITTTASVVRFSNQAGLQDTILEYVAGARIIHDIEAYEEIQTLFFRDTIDFSEATIAERLTAVRAERDTADTFARDHVYSTSYYTGNLLVRSEETLHELLLEVPRPQTTILLETVLADVRSGVLKLQIHFDQATPAQYDQSLASALYFTTPSFPSLTVTEAASVLYVLALVDPVNARHYERALHQYVNQVYQSGAHFRIDIEYALALAELYHQIITTDSQYEPLIAAAVGEWSDSTEIVPVALSLQPRFVVKNFPTETKLGILPGDFSYTARVNDEVIAGNLFLTLIDTRLPDPAPRLYHYDIGADRLLPHGVDMVSREQPLLETFAAFASYLDASEYTFVTGPAAPLIGLEPYHFSTSRIVSRKDNRLEKVVGEAGDAYLRLDPRVSKNTGQVLFSESRAEVSTQSMVKVRGGGLPEVTITNARHPEFVLDDTYIVFIRDGAVWGAQNVVGAAPIRLVDLGEGSALPGSIVGLSYAPDSRILTTHSSLIDPITGVPQSNITLQVASVSDEQLTVNEVASFTVRDFQVQSTALSPGGAYLAVAGTEAFSQVAPQVLIFNTMSGIVEKDIPLSPFAAQLMHLDDWSL